MNNKTKNKKIKAESAQKKIKKKSKPSKHSYKYWSEKSKRKGRDDKHERLVDFHVHSVGSSDGIHDISTLVSRAKNFEVDYISVTDHNSFNETVKYLNANHADLKLAIHDMDGINFIPGVEITCRVGDVKNYKGNDLKVHLLVYSPILTENSYLMKLMKIKHGNDLAVDFGMLLNIAKLKGIQLDPDSIRDFMIRQRLHGDSGFSSFGQDEVMAYFKKQKINIAKSARAFSNMFDTIPRAERLNLSAEDVISLAHASGGMCVMAHPKVHLQRTNNRQDAVDSLLEYGIDGFELMTPSMDNDTFTLITRECSRFNSRNTLLYTGGSDFHIYGDHSKIGRFGDLPITAKSQDPVIKELQTLNKARKQECLTHRDYKMLLTSEMDYIIQKYSEKAHEINEIYTDNQKKMGLIESDDSFVHTNMAYVDYLKERGVYDEGM